MVYSSIIINGEERPQILYASKFFSNISETSKFEAKLAESSSTSQIESKTILNVMGPSIKDFKEKKTKILLKKNRTRESNAE